MVYKEVIKGAPCKRACLAGVDIPRYVRLANQGKFGEALAVIRERNPFPSVCSRICNHSCEKACQSTHGGEPLAINALKRFVTERAFATHESLRTKSSDKRVAIVGSGPAGLTAAYYLARLGHRVIIFEALAELGGMLRFGVPEYRLPRILLDKDINEIKGSSIEIRTNTRVDSLDELWEEGYSAILLALGAQSGCRLMVEGESNPGVMQAVNLLKDVNSGRRVKLGDKVAVVGGGYAAVDSARTALRLASKEVTIICPWAKADVSVNQEEVKAALYEGVKITFLAMPERIVRKDSKLDIFCTRVKPDKDNASGQWQPLPIKGSSFSIDVNSIIVAIGETPDIPSQFNLKMGKGNNLQVSRTLETSQQGVFAGGDVIAGQHSVIRAIADGRRAAISIDKYLGGSGEIKEVLSLPEEELPLFIHGPSVGKRTTMPALSLKERLSGFREVDLGFDEEMALRESSRCLWCDMPILTNPAKCVGCLQCALMCSSRFEKAFNPSNAKIKIVPPDRSTPPGESEISFADDCDACGICVRACAYGALTRREVKDSKNAM